MGQHGSMSRHEMNNILFAAGPGFKSNIRSQVPSGNLDLTPTILRILDISGETAMHGRVLEEALSDGPGADGSDWRTESHQSEADMGGEVYRQQIKISTVGTTSYVDEGSRT